MLKPLKKPAVGEQRVEVPCLCLAILLPTSHSIHSRHAFTQPHRSTHRSNGMYRRCLATAAASSSSQASSSLLLLRRRSNSNAAIAIARQAASTTPLAGGGTGTERPPTPRQRPQTLAMAAASMPLSTHAATGQSASEFLDDPGLLRDKAYVNGQWVDAQGEATFAVEGESCLAM